MLYLLYFLLSIQVYFAGCNNQFFKNGCCCCTKKHDVKSNSDKKANNEVGELQTEVKDKKLSSKGNMHSLLKNNIKNLENIKQRTSSNAGNLLNIGQKALTTNADVKSINQNIITQPSQNVNTFNHQGAPVERKSYFPLKGLDNVGSTCYMNAVLQCLLHIRDLIDYFIYEYPKDKNMLKSRNKLADSQGEISKAFYEVVEGVTKGNRKSYAPKNFKKTLAKYNSQFTAFEANDAKDLMQYLLQTIHAELNYFGDQKALNFPQSNQCNREATFLRFMNTYNATDFSIMTKHILGTYETETICHKCKYHIYNYQKFEILSIPMFKYSNRKFNILNGFEDMLIPQQLSEKNKFYCNICKNLEDAETTNKIIQPSKYLIINIDYGINKAYKPSQFDFNENLDITKYVCHDFGVPIIYRLIGVCTHLGSSGQGGHYIAFCKNTQTNKWYEFNDSKVTDKNVNINQGSPYLLIYERI